MMAEKILKTLAEVWADQYGMKIEKIEIKEVKRMGEN